MERYPVDKKKKIEYILLVYLNRFICFVCMVVHVELRRQFVGVSFLLNNDTHTHTHTHTHTSTPTNLISSLCVCLCVCWFE